MDVAIVDAVLKSSIGRILRRSRMCMKQVRESWVMWSEKLRCWSKITPRFRTGEFAEKVWLEEESLLKEIEGSGIFLSCSLRPISINSVLEGLRQRRFEVIQEVIWVTTERRVSMESEKLLGEKEMNNWVSSAYR